MSVVVLPVSRELKGGEDLLSTLDVTFVFGKIVCFLFKCPFVAIVWV